MSQFKVVTIGESGVGKTTIVNTFYDKAVDTKTTPTVGASYVNCRVDVDQKGPIVLNIWDTAGQEKFQSLIPLYMRNARGVLFVFDLSTTNSIPQLEKAYSEYEDIIEPRAVTICCGNKLDLVTDRSFCKIAEDWATEKGMECFWTSGRTGEGIDEMFTRLASKMVNAVTPMKRSAVDEIVEEPGENKKGCCK